jgi:hypothetical protein
MGFGGYDIKSDLEFSSSEGFYCGAPCHELEVILGVFYGALLVCRQD